jgi:hypothetical protein
MSEYVRGLTEEINGPRAETKMNERTVYYHILGSLEPALELTLGLER